MMQSAVRGAYPRAPLPTGFFGNHLRLAPQGQWLLLLFLLFLLLSPLLLPATFARAETLTVDTGQETAIPWTLEADRITGRHDAAIIEAHGNVILRHGRDSLKADFARYFRSTRWIFLKGSVKALWQEDQLEAEEAEFDLVNQEGWLKKGRLFVSGPHLYFSGDVIRKLRGDEYKFKNAKITACDGDNPAWSLSAESGEITIDGYAKLRKASFRLGGRTAMYTPHLILPVKTRRQSGLLVPDTGYSSRLGAQINQPIYWTLDETSDVTVYENFMSRRGLMQGLEYRHRPNLKTMGLWKLDYLHDSVIAPRESDHASPLDQDGLVRSNRNRYWWRSKYNGALLDTGWDVKLDMDMVSDQDYLREFNTGISGYNRSADMFLDRFGREIEQADQNRTSTLLVSQSWDRVGAAGKLEYVQNVEQGHGNSPSSQDPSLQRLPELALFLYKDRLGDLPLELEGEASAVRFWRRYGTTGSRLDMQPRLSLPLKVGFATLIPTAGWRQTFYAVDRYENHDTDHAGPLPVRGIPDLGISAFTDAFKVYGISSGQGLDLSKANLNKSLWTSVKHGVQARMDYAYRPFRRQAQNPFFDQEDRLLAQNELTYSLTNIFSRKRETVVSGTNAGEGETLALHTDYQDFLRFRLEQSYDLREAERVEQLSTYPKRPFSDILADISVQPREYVTLRNRTWYSSYLGRITEHEHLLELDVPEKGSLLFGLDFQRNVNEYKRQSRESIRMLRLGLSMFVLRRWSVGIGYRGDLDRSKDLEKTLGLSYTHQCYNLHFLYSQTPIDNRFELRFDLLGLNLFD